MTVFVETDFLLALLKDDDWLQKRAETFLAENDVVTAPYAYLELLVIRERYEFDSVDLIANLLDVVPVGTDDEAQIVLKATKYCDDGLTPFDAFHAATAETRGHDILSSDGAYDAVDAERIALEPGNET